VQESDEKDSKESLEGEIWSSLDLNPTNKHTTEETRKLSIRDILINKDLIFTKPTTTLMATI